MARATFAGLGKTFGGVAALADFTLEVADGELITVLGPSGCGKSTLLRLTAGLEPPSSGTIALDGTRIDHLPPDARDVAMVFQSYALYPHMTVRRNVEFPLRMRGVGRAERQQRVEEVTALLELTPLLERRPAELSGGQRQRVALARALVRRPKLFLLDEPLSNVDARLRASVRQYIRDMQRRLRVTTLYVTHDQVEAMTLGDRVVVMKDGIVQQVGEPLELYNNPANRFVAGFIGSPAMNFAAVTMTDGNGKLTAKNSGLEIEVPPAQAERLRSRVGQQLTLGVRPENLHVAGDADPAGLTFASKVEVIEQLGSEILLDVRVGNDSMVAAVDPTTRTKVQESLRLAVNPERLHFFDADTEMAI